MPQLRRPTPRPVRKNRMAAEQVAEIFLPWSKRPTEGGAGQGGRTQKQWIENNRLIADKLDSMSTEQDMFNYLVNEQGFDSREAEGVARQAYNAQGPLRQLRTEAWGVPNAAADEMLNMAVLMNSGFTNVQPGVFKGTDILAVSPDGRQLGIDSQMRTGVSSNWSIPVLGSANTATEAFRDPYFANASLGDFIDEMIQENPRAWADKLLHDPALHREFFGTGLMDGKQKDALISTRRSRRTYNPRRDNALGANKLHGPYNPQPGDTVDLMDMGALREKLLNQSLAELQQGGIRSVGGMNSGGFRLSVPDSVVQSLTNNVGTLDLDIVRALSR